MKNYLWAIDSARTEPILTIWTSPIENAVTDAESWTELCPLENWTEREISEREFQTKSIILRDNLNWILKSENLQGSAETKV